MNLPTATHRYFAASNSARGFCNYYGECFSDTRVDRLYIIKGGPGTGKSHFMRTVAAYARRADYAVTEYACSSDPASLDGVLLTRDGAPRVGLLDGTAPHVREPTVPGVREEIINLGALWDGSRLMGEGDTIRALGARKTAAYARAYAYLHAAGEMDRVADDLVAPAVREDRLRAMAERILRREPAGKVFDAQPALRRAVSMAGRATLSAFEEDATSLLILDSAYGLGYRLTEHLLRRSRDRGLSLLVSYDPVYPDKADGLYYPASGLCVLVGAASPREGCPTREISLRRYTDADILRTHRPEIRHAVSLRNTMEEDALRALAEAGEYHFELEGIYAAAMDFGAKETFTKRFCEKLFGEIG